MLILFGSTGMVGAEVLHLALTDPRVTRVVSISRRPTGVVHPNLFEVIHRDFLHLAALEPHLAAATSCIHWVLPFLGVGAVDLARVLIAKAVAGSGSQLLTNADIRLQAKSLRTASGGSRPT